MCGDVIDLDDSPDIYTKIWIQLKKRVRTFLMKKHFRQECRNKSWSIFTKYIMRLDNRRCKITGLT